MWNSGWSWLWLASGHYLWHQISCLKWNQCLKKVKFLYFLFKSLKLICSAHKYRFRRMSGKVCDLSEDPTGPKLFGRDWELQFPKVQVAEVLRFLGNKISVPKPNRNRSRDIGSCENFFGKLSVEAFRHETLKRSWQQQKSWEDSVIAHFEILDLFF